MENEIKCGKREETKSGFHEGKQRCKSCGCNYTGGHRGCPDYVKLQAIKYYLEGNGFRRIERLMHVSHVSVANWIKQLASKIENIPQKISK